MATELLPMFLAVVGNRCVSQCDLTFGLNGSALKLWNENFRSVELGYRCQNYQYAVGRKIHVQSRQKASPLKTAHLFCVLIYTFGRSMKEKLAEVL